MSSADQQQQPAKVITIHNASACTAFELRQELVRRNAFDLDETKISVNYRSLLQRLMAELVREDEAVAAERQRQKEAEAAEAREKAKLDREAKKQEALERSRQRREADPGYFEKRKAAEPTSGTSTSNGTTGTGQQEKPHTSEDTSIVAEAPSSQQEEEGGDDDEDGPDDPFRTYKHKGRSKIFVR